MEQRRYGESLESVIDREAEDLLSKILRNEASDEEQTRFFELSTMRSSLMLADPATTNVARRFG